MKFSNYLLDFKEFIRRYFNNHFSHKYIELYQTQITAFGILMLINFPLFYTVWHNAGDTYYENLDFRLFNAALCIPLVLCRWWPEKLKVFLPIYWYITIITVLPCFFTYMTLMNHGAVSWLMNTISVLFFMLLLLDNMTFIIVVSLGALIGYLLFLNSNTAFYIHPGLVNATSLMATYSAAIIIGVIFSYNNAKIERERRKTLTVFASSFAHELRTPLASVKLAASMITKALPELVEHYRELDVGDRKFSDRKLDMIVSAPAEIESETDASLAFIENMLINVKQPEVTKENMRDLSIRDCIMNAVVRYPFQEVEESKLYCHLGPDFRVLADETLLIHLFFNLLKNANYHIEKVGEGEIFITTKLGQKFNFVHFRDTSQGISDKDLPHVFDHFFSKTHHGTGVGLSYCREIMHALGGNISCDSVYGEYTTFTLSFPKVRDS